MTRIKLGEGAYGCVHKPSIHCKSEPKPGFKYDKYVSKIMKTKNAQDELAEFVVIKNIDPTDEYHLGEPILCKPKLDELNVRNDIKKCKHISIADIEAKPDDYSLLVMKFGGPDLKALCKTYLTKYLDKNKEERTDKFWLETHHLLKGLKFFRDNGIVHNDIKPQNILFDSINGKMKYIDFGLMRTKQEVISSSKKDENYLGIFHWSYPFDCGFMDKVKYTLYKAYNKDKKTKLTNELTGMILAGEKTNSFNLPIKHPDAFEILFTYLNPADVSPDASTQIGYIQSFFDGFNELIARNSYDYMLEHITNSIDVFGLGFTLQFMANCFKRHSALSLEDYTRLSAFFHKMYDFNPATRVINIEALINEYENVLLEIGVLTRLGKSFEHNMLVNRPPVPPAIIKSASKTLSKPLSPELQEFANQDAIDISVKCPPEKEFNPIIQRCVKKCKPGFIRNAKFKCAKETQRVKSKRISRVRSRVRSRVKSILTKICPPDKDLNPRTKRCVKKCQPGFIRNAAFQCRRRETRKRETSKSKSKSKTRSIIV